MEMYDLGRPEFNLSKPPKPIMNFNRNDLKGLSLKFPTSIVRYIAIELVFNRMIIEKACLPNL